MASQNNSDIVRCLKCRTVLNESPSLTRSQRTPCPVCGSLSRDNLRVIAAEVSVSLHMWRARAKRQGKGEPFIDQYLKRELYRDTGQNHDVERTIDHERNIYREVIRDSKTGELIHDCYEPLDKHTGHGDAKRKGGAG